MCAYINKPSSILARVDIDKLVDFSSKAYLASLKPHYKAYEVLDMESVRQNFFIALSESN